MASTIEGLRVEVRVSGMIRGADGAKQVVLLDYDKQFTDGTGTDSIGQFWWDQTRALNNTSEDLDLAGSLPIFNGDMLALTDMKVLVLENLATATGDNVILKEGSSNPVAGLLGGTNPTLTLGPSGLLVWVSPVDGVTVTAGSADTIAIQTNDNMNYQVFVAGEDA